MCIRDRMLLLCGCGGMTTDDAMDYVQSALDCGYKAEVKKYAEITETTEKEAKKEYETDLEMCIRDRKNLPRCTECRRTDFCKYR